MTQCPKAEIIHPCICTDSTQDNSSTIICKDTEFIDLKAILAKASKSLQRKNFTQFILENNPMDAIVSRVFSDLHFTKVHFINCTNLTNIDQEAFGGQTPFMEELVFKNTPILNQPPNELDLFDAINRLPSLKIMDLSGTQLTTIPNEAFMTILPWLDHQVKHVYFCSDGQLCRSIKSVGKLAFYYLYKIQLIDLSRHRISYIDEHAFSIHNLTTESKLNIILDDNELNAESFHQNAFEYIGEPTYLSLVNNKNLTHLRQDVFETFLKDNELNELNVTHCPIEWNADNMKWIKNAGTKYINRIHF